MMLVNAIILLISVILPKILADPEISAPTPRRLPSTLPSDFTFSRGPWKALLDAAYAGDIQKVEYEILNGTDVNIKGKLDVTALYAASMNDKKEMITELLKYGADINAKDIRGGTALHRAVYDNKISMVDFLILSGANMNIQEKNGTPLHLAVQKVRQECIEILVESGANKDALTPNNASIPGYTALHLAVYNDENKIVDYLLKSGARADILTQDGWSLLRLAAYRGNVEVMETLLEHGLTINDKNDQGYTALHAAALKGHVKMVELLIRKGALLDIQDFNGWTALYTAVVSGFPKIVDMLLRAGANKNIQTNIGRIGGRTALFEAVKKGNAEIVDLLIANGADLNIPDQYGYRPLHVAAFYGWINIIRRLVNNGANIYLKNKTGKTPLDMAINEDIRKALRTAPPPPSIQFSSGVAEMMISAAREGNFFKIEQMVQSGININIKDNMGLFALYVATKYGHDELIKSLLSLGANVNIVDSAGWTPLHRVAFDGKLSTAQILIDNNANLNIKQKENLTALYLAVQENHQAMVELLVKRGANMDIETSKGYTAILQAALDDKQEIFEFLIKSGADLNIRTIDGLSVMHFAALKGRDKIIKLLLQKGLDVNIHTNDGKTALFTAISEGRDQIVEILLRNGALTNVSDSSNKTPMDLAIAGGNGKIIDLLRNAEELRKEDETGLTLGLTGRPSEQACKVYEKLPINRILGGVAVDGSEFPWMAALGYLSDQYRVSFDCGGTVISDYFVLTAGHCAKPSRSPVVVRLGKLTLSDDNDGIRPANHQIREIIRHPNHSILTAKNDIALIRLMKKIVFCAEVIPACLQTDLRDENSNVKMIITGWGISDEEVNKRPDKLRKAQVQTMPLDECNLMFSNYNILMNLPALRDGISSSQYCAYDPQGKNDSCQGDSGGPLQYFRYENSSIATITGIVSFGISCGSTLPGIYTRVAYYLDWIESIVWPNSN